MGYAGGQVRPPQAKSAQTQKPEASDDLRREDLPRGETRFVRGQEGSDSYECMELRADGTMRKSVSTEGKVTTTIYYAENGTTPTLVVRRAELESGDVSIVKTFADGRMESWSGTSAEEEQLKDQMMASVGMDRKAIAKAKLRKPALFGDAKSAVTGPDKKPEAPASAPPAPPAKKPEEKD